MSNKPLFPLGQIVATPGAFDVLGEANITPSQLIARHVVGDWGQLCAEDKKLNDEAVENGERTLSVYEVGGETIWVITEWDRSASSIILASEY